MHEELVASIIAVDRIEQCPVHSSRRSSLE